MASLSKRFSTWRLRVEEPEEEKNELGSRHSHETDDSGYWSKLSGLESRTARPLPTIPISRHTCPQSPLKTLRQRASNLISDMSTSVRSKAPLLHSMPLPTDNYEHSLSQTLEPETSKALRRGSSVASSLKSRRNPFSVRTRNLERGSLDSSRTPVTASDEEPPKLDVKIPCSSLNENLNGPANSRVSRTNTRTNLSSTMLDLYHSPGKINADQLPNFESSSALHAVPAALEDPYVKKGDSDCRGNRFITSALKLISSTEPKNRFRGGDKSYLVMAETNTAKKESSVFSLIGLDAVAIEVAETEDTSRCPYCRRSGFRVSASSVEQRLSSRPNDSQKPYITHTTSLEDGLQKLLVTTSLNNDAAKLLPSTSDERVNKQTSVRRFISPDTDEADIYPSDASVELPSKRFQAAWQKRKAERHSRYLEAIAGAETDSDTSIHASLKLRRIPTRNPLEQPRTRKYKTKAGADMSLQSKAGWQAELPYRLLNKSKVPTNSTRSKVAKSEKCHRYGSPSLILGYGSPSFILGYGSETDGTGTTASDEESLATESATMNCAAYYPSVAYSEQHSSLPVDRDRDSEKCLIPDGNTHDLQRKPDSARAKPFAYALTVFPKYMTSINHAPKDTLAFQARNSETVSSGSESTQADVDSAPKQEVFQPISSNSSTYSSENERVLKTQETATTTMTAADPNFCDSKEREVLQGYHVNDDVCIWPQASLDPDKRAPLTYPAMSIAPQEGACLIASPLSLGSPASPLRSEPHPNRRQTRKKKRAAYCEGSPCSRSKSVMINGRSSKSTSRPRFASRRVESHEVKPTVHIGSDLDNELTHSFKEGSHRRTKSNSPFHTPRGHVNNTSYVGQNLGAISCDGTSDRPLRSSSPKRPTKRMSITETQSILQKELENEDSRNEDSCTHDANIESPKTNALVESEPHTLDKPRWRVPGSTMSKVLDTVDDDE